MTGSPAIARRMPTKSPRCIGSDLFQRRRSLLGGLGQDHLAHGGDPILVEKHVLGAAQPDSLGAELARDRGVVRGVGVGAHAQACARRPPSS